MMESRLLEVEKHGKIKAMKIAVFAYHRIGYECLNVLIEAGEEVVAVVTHEDDPREEVWFPSVARLARMRGLPVYTPSNPNTPDFIGLVRRLEPDLILSFYYRRLLSKELLAIPRLGGINLHGSLLPKYRGRAPVNWVLVNGEAETGVTLHYMVEEADAGDIISQRRVPIEAEDTALDLFGKITVAGRELLRETLPLIKGGTAPRIPQDHSRASTFGRRHPEDGRIVWEQPARAIYNLIRAVTHPFPGAFTFYEGRKLYLWAAALPDSNSFGAGRLPGTVEGEEIGRGMVVRAGDGCLVVTRAQLEGEEEMAGDEIMRRCGIRVGARIGE